MRKLYLDFLTFIVTYKYTRVIAPNYPEFSNASPSAILRLREVTDGCISMRRGSLAARTSGDITPRDIVIYATPPSAENTAMHRDYVTIF